MQEKDVFYYPMNKEYNDVKEYRGITGSNSQKGYDRYSANTDIN